MIVKLTDPAEIAQAQAEQRLRLLAQGFPESWADVGEVFCDQYVRIVRDAVRFPTGTLGTYIRLLPGKSVHGGVIIVPKLSGRYVLIRHYRHATGRIHLEFPRGIGKAGEAPHDAAMREMKEEIGADAAAVRRLGELQADTGMTSLPLQVYAADILHAEATHTREPIAGIETMTGGELMAQAAAGKFDDALTLASFLLDISGPSSGAAVPAAGVASEAVA